MILMDVALKISPSGWALLESCDYFKVAILRGDEGIAGRIMGLCHEIDTKKPLKLSDVFRACNTAYGLSKNDLLISIEVMVRQSVYHNIPDQDLNDALGCLISKCDLHPVEVINWLLQVGRKLRPAISDWTPSSANLLPRNWAMLCGPSSFPEDELSVFVQQIRTMGQPSCSTFVDALVPIYGCVTAAKSGQEALHQYILALDDYATLERDRMLQMALLEVVGQGDIEKAKLLLDIGVDPEAKLLPRIEYGAYDEKVCYLDPISQGARKSDIYMLEFLLEYGFHEPQHVVDALMAVSLAWKTVRSLHDPPRLSTKQAATVTFLSRFNPRGIWETPVNREMPCQNLVSDFFQQKIDQQAPSILPFTLLPNIFPRHTLRKAIKHGFSLSAIEYLVSMGERVDSEQDENGNTLLIDSLLSDSRDRYQVTHLLLQKGTDPRVNSLEFTVLKATLWNTVISIHAVTRTVVRHRSLNASPAAGRLDRAEDLKVALSLFKELLTLGAPLERDIAHQNPISKTLLVLLIQCHADLAIVQETVEYGANINEQCEKHIATLLGIEGIDLPQRAMHMTTPLAYAIQSGQLSVANWLIAQGADGNALGALAYVCRLGDTRLVQLLIDKRADLEPPGESFYGDPLCQAISHGQMDIVIMLFARGARINHPKGPPGLD